MQAAALTFSQLGKYLDCSKDGEEVSVSSRSQLLRKTHGAGKWGQFSRAAIPRPCSSLTSRRDVLAQLVDIVALLQWTLELDEMEL